MATVRDVDLVSGRPTFSLLLDRASEFGNRIDSQPVKKKLHGLLLTDILESSGVGRVADHISQAWSRELDGSFDSRGTKYRDEFFESVHKGVAGSLKRATRLATGASSLAAPLLDNESSYNQSASAARERALGFMRWGTPEPSISRAALKAVGSRRLVLDEGHRDAVVLVDDVRTFADIHGSASDWDLFDEDDNQSDADDAIDQGGFVREERDDGVLSLQVADVATGWARTLLLNGYKALTDEFRFVIYNGSQLTREGAREIDTSIAEHRRLHEKRCGG